MRIEYQLTYRDLAKVDGIHIVKIQKVFCA